MAAGRPGRRPTPLPPPCAGVLLDYATQVGRADLTAQARRSYLSRTHAERAASESPAGPAMVLDVSSATRGSRRPTTSESRCHQAINAAI